MEKTCGSVFTLILCLAVIFYVEVGSEILSLSGKYSNVHARRIDSLIGLETSSRRSSRHTRSTSNGKAASQQNKLSNGSKIIINKFEFINAEKADHIYVNTLGENSNEKIFILMVNFDFSGGWASVKESVLWCSDDHGESFHVRNFSQDTKISFMYAIPSNPQKMILTDTENKMVYTTEDGLIHSMSCNVPVEPELVIPHPSNENKLLIYSYTELKLYGSDDFAASWTLVAEGVITPIYWGDPDFDESEDVVHLQIEGEIPSQGFYKACLLPGCQPVHEDLEKVGPFMAGTLMVHKEYMFVQKENQNGSESFLMVSYKRENFVRAQFPSNDKTSNFLILNLDDHQVFVAVHHGNTVNLYLSDVTGQYYVLSLADVFHDEKLDWFEVDFAEVKGMNWTFMANKMKKTGSSAPDLVQTYVSYDKGGNWAPLFVNKSCSKVESCSLLLELKESYEIDPMESINMAPGIIVGHGLLGQSHQKRLASVFVTNDGGATWNQAPFNSTCFLRILNYGGLITAIPDESSSKIIHYSLDQGKSWQSQTFEENGLSDIEWITVEKTDGALIQSIFGRESRKKPWKYVKLNMTSILPNKCDDSDYESWSPKDYNAGDSTKKCILGRVVQYRRRKPEALCYNDEISTSHVVNNSACPCTDEDYECDFGFEKAGDGCRKAAWLYKTFVPSECDNGGEYNQSQGYRKIPADVCIENEADKKKYDRKKAPCPSSAPMGLSLMTEVKTIQLGKQIIFSLEQARGSKWDTKYTWDFGDSSELVSDTGFKNASQKQHAFQTSGSFSITVTAQNMKGEAKASWEVRVQDRLTKLRILAPWAAVKGQEVKIDAMPMSRAQIFPTDVDSIHYLWSFGDEASNSRPMLSWNSTMTHAYAKAGTYNIKIEASNSISSVSEEFPVTIFESAVVLELELESSSPYLVLKNSLVISLLTQSLRQQVAQDLGVDRDRLVASSSNNQSVVYLYLFHTKRANEMSVTEMKDKIIDQANKGMLGFDLFATHLNSKDLIKIISAKEVIGPPSTNDKKSGPNLTPVYVAVPVLAVVLISLVAVGVFVYRRRRAGAGARYSLFESQDESDTMLDDEDVAPLNMNLEISGGASARDDSLIDTGGNYLVMETGGGRVGNEEIC